MKINDPECHGGEEYFSSKVVMDYKGENVFLITTTQESEISTDGGYSHEVVTHRTELELEEAKELYEELHKFILLSGEEKQDE